VTAADGQDSRLSHDALARAVDRAAGSRAIPGNAVHTLTDGPEIFAALERLLAGAQRWIHFENYIIHDDATGRRFAGLLEAAAAREVEVRVLYDALGCRATRRAFWRRLRQRGVSVRAFAPLNPLKPLRSLRRNHTKYAAADGRLAVTGGFCIGDEWAGDATRAVPPWRDTGVEVAGPAVPVLELAFLRAWLGAGGEPPRHALPAAAPESGSAVIRPVEGVPGRWRLARAAQLLIAGAASRVWITDAYLMAPSVVFSALVSAARDGVDVRLLLPGHTDLPAIRALTRVGYRELLEAGARIWEWRGPMMHAKTMVVDDHWLKVGSSNLNPSSLALNHELDLLVEDRGGTAAAAGQFLRDLGNAVEIILRARPVARRLPPAVVRADPTVPRVPPVHLRERSQRAVVALRQVAGGARRSIFGAVMFAFLGMGTLLVALPQVMAYALALVCLGLAVAAARQFLARRRSGE
jgi:cardiolipin synthase